MGPGLPELFLIKMEMLLGEEYNSFLQSYNTERAQGLRLNPLKVLSEAEKAKLVSRDTAEPVWRFNFQG